MVAKSALNQLVVLRELRADWWFSERSERSEQIGGSQGAPDLRHALNSFLRSELAPSPIWQCPRFADVII